jgi:cytosine/adenosine deaminase-related metal-dependent hydrolase
MTFHKYSASSIFDGRSFSHDTVLITDENGFVHDLVRSVDAGENIQWFDGMLVPGFVNAHCHLELSHLKGRIPKGCGFVPFLKQVLALRGMEADTIRMAIEQAEDEMIREGIVAVGDICNTSDSINQKLKKRLYYHSFIETSGFSDEIANARFDAAKLLKKSFVTAFGKEAVTITPHAPYSVGNRLFDRICAEEELLSIHNQEDDSENRFFLMGDGPLLQLYSSLKMDISNFIISKTSSLQAVWKHFRNGQSIVFVHNVATRKDDIEFISQQETKPVIYWCVCPNANLYITGNLPDVQLLKQKGQIVLGTDSLASNHQLSILEEMKTLHRHFPEITLQELLQWATINGAEALAIDKVFGSFEKRKKPGIVLLHGLKDNLINDAVARSII